MSPNENPKLIELGFFRFSIGKKFRDNYPWGMEGNDMYAESNLRKSGGEFSTKDQSEMIKYLFPEKQLSLAREYTEIFRKIMHDAGVPGY